MSLLRRLELMDRSPFFPPPSSLFLSDLFDDVVVYDDVLLNGLDLVLLPEPYPQLDAVSDLLQGEALTPFHRGSFYRGRVTRRVATSAASDPFLLSLLDRVTALEHRFERVLGGGRRERKYEWTAEIEGKDVDRKYKWKAEISPRKEKGGESFKWVTEVKEKAEGGERTYTWTERYGGEDKKHEKEKKDKGKKEKKGAEYGTRLVEIEEPADDRRAVVLRQVCIISQIVLVGFEADSVPGDF